MFRKKLLLVDDSSTNNMLIKSYFEEENYTVLTAEDGPTALDILNSEMPDLILLDIMMPGMDGYQVLTKIKSNPVTRRIPVIVVSAKDKKADITKAFELGAIDYITKPVGLGNLFEIVERLIGH